MISFVLGTVFGVVVAISCFVAALIMLYKSEECAEVYKEDKKPSSSDVSADSLMNICKQQAEMDNFWNYDGSKQTDADEKARQMYDKAVMKRGGR